MIINRETRQNTVIKEKIKMVKKKKRILGKMEMCLKCRSNIKINKRMNERERERVREND